MLESDVSPPLTDATTWRLLSSTSCRYQSLHDQCATSSRTTRCQLQVAKLHHCLEALDQLEATSEQGHIANNGDTTSNSPITRTSHGHNQLHQLRAAITETIKILRQQRFAHLRNEQFLRTRQLLQQDFQQRLTTRDMECHETPPRTRSAPAQPRWRSYVRTAMPYDLLLWQRNQLPQFDPDSDSE